MEKERKWSVEYSVSQDCFHVDGLDIRLKDNFATLVTKRSNDYKIIAICDTQDEACEFASKCRKEMERIENER